MKPFDRSFLLRRLLDLSALLCLWFVFQWRANYCCSMHGMFGDLPAWKTEFIVRYDRGAWSMESPRSRTELFGGFNPRGFRCTHHDETFPFRFMRATDGTTSQWVIAVPIFPLFLLSAGVLGTRLVLTLRTEVPRRRSQLAAWRECRAKRLLLRGRQTCRRCGYDLRATPHRCPECGLVPAGVEVSATHP